MIQSRCETRGVNLSRKTSVSC